MTLDELNYAHFNNIKVRVVNHDYVFIGWVVSIYHKYNAPNKVRCVIENGDGVNLTQSLKNLEFETFFEEYKYTKDVRK